MATQEIRDRVLDRLVSLAANGRIKPDEILNLAKQHEAYVAGEDLPTV